MSEFKINKAIEIPPRQTGLGSGKYPWDKLKVGDSFFVADRDSSNIQAPTRLTRRGYKFATRKWAEGKQTGVRVWRIA